MGARSVRLTLMGALLLAGATTAHLLAAEELNRHYHETFPVRPGMRLRLDHGDGDVAITPWNRDSLEVTVRYRAKASTLGWSKRSDFEVEFRREGDTVHVVGHEPERRSVGISMFRELEHSYTIRAPSYLRLALDGEDGDVEVDEWTGPISVRLEDGDVRLSGIRSPRTEVNLEDGDLRIMGLQGELLVEVEDGDVEIFDCDCVAARFRLEDGDLTLDRGAGSLQVRAADGRVRLSRLAAAELEVRVSDGSVDVGLLPSNRLDLDVRVNDGPVEVVLDPAISAEFTLETRDGRIRVEASRVGSLQQERRRVTGRLGDGGGSIFVSSVDGSITLRQ